MSSIANSFTSTSTITRSDTILNCSYPRIVDILDRACEQEREHVDMIDYLTRENVALKAEIAEIKTNYDPDLFKKFGQVKKDLQEREILVARLKRELQNANQLKQPTIGKIRNSELHNDDQEKHSTVNMDASKGITPDNSTFMRKPFNADMESTPKITADKESASKMVNFMKELGNDDPEKECAVKMGGSNFMQGLRDAGKDKQQALNMDDSSFIKELCNNNQEKQYARKMDDSNFMWELPNDGQVKKFTLQMDDSGFIEELGNADPEKECAVKMDGSSFMWELRNGDQGKQFPLKMDQNNSFFECSMLFSDDDDQADLPLLKMDEEDSSLFELSSLLQELNLADQENPFSNIGDEDDDESSGFASFKSFNDQPAEYFFNMDESSITEIPSLSQERLDGDQQSQFSLNVDEEDVPQVNDFNTSTMSAQSVASCFSFYRVYKAGENN